MKNKPLLEFAKLISGIFSNKEQALNDPKRFSHIQLHIRPLFFSTFKCYAFYSEQRFQHDIWNPYRQSINKLSNNKEIFILSNHEIENKERLTGGGLDMSYLNQISEYKLHKKHGCSMHFRKNNQGSYIGLIEPGRNCYVQERKEKIHVKSKVILNDTSLISEDSGIEEETGRKVWGSDYGPFVLKKINNFDKFIESNWNLD